MQPHSCHSDPEDDIPFAEMLYNDEDFVETLYNSLTDNGVIVLQLGEAPGEEDPGEQFTKSSRRQTLINLLEKVGFETMHFFEDSNCGFEAPWSFLVAIKDETIESRWYMSEAAVEVEIHGRTVRTVSGKPALKYFDGSVKRGYHYPHKGAERVFCRSLPTPSSCEVEDVSGPDVPSSAFEVRMSSIGDGSGRGVFATVDIKAGSSIAIHDNNRFVRLSPEGTVLVKRYMNQSASMKSVFAYAHGYGLETHTFVSHAMMLLIISLMFTTDMINTHIFFQ